jgi:hypothetical protein
LKIIETQVIIFKVGNRMFTNEFLVAPLDTEYSGVLGVDVLRNMEASVNLRISTLVLGRKFYRLSGQEVDRCQLIQCQCRPLQEVSNTGLINPETALMDRQAEVPIPGLSPGGPDIDCWNIVALGSVIFPSRCLRDCLVCVSILEFHFQKTRVQSTLYFVRVILELIIVWEIVF